MKNYSFSRQSILLISGDILALAVMTLVGFATHRTAGTAGARMLTTFLPVVVAWFLVAPHLQVYDQASARDVRQLWRPFWAMLLAAPLAAWLRGAWLGTPILPVFVFVLGGMNALALLVWRGAYLITVSRMTQVHG